MSDRYEEPDAAKAAVKILSSKFMLPRFTEAEGAAIAKYQRARADRELDEEIRTFSDDLKRELALARAAQEDELLRRALTLRSPVTPQGAGHVQARPALHGLGDRLRAGCNAHVASPPYSTGDPLMEQVGSDAIFVPNQFTATALPSGLLPAAEALKTFSQLAIPGEGELSLGVGLGSFETITGRVVHLPSESHPQSFPVMGGLLEVTRAQASLGYHFAVPGAPLRRQTDIEVTVDFAVGDPARPFYVVIPPRLGPPIVQAFGVANVTLLSSSGGEAAARTRFLEHREGASGIFGTPVQLREFSISQKLALETETSWMYIGIEVLLEVQRWFIPPPPPAEERPGLAVIDLRSPAHDTHDIHFVLGAGGPVRVLRIETTLCPEPVFVRTS